MKLEDVDIEDLELDLPKKKKEPVEEIVEDIYDTYESTTYAPHKKKKSPFVTALFVLLFLLAVTIVVIFALYAKNSPLFSVLSKETETAEEPEITYTAEEVEAMISEAVDTKAAQVDEAVRNEMKQTLLAAANEDSGVLLLLREYFPDDVVFIQGSKYEFYPINYDLRQSTFDNTRVRKDEETGYITYVDENENVISHMGIDVSSFQKDVNWGKVKKAGVEFAFIRAGFRGYESGKLNEDKYFQANIEGALDEDIAVGVYFYTAAINEEEAIEEADFLLEMLEPYEIKLPVVLDMETNPKGSRTYDLTVEDKMAIIKAFNDHIEEAGYETMMYGGQKFFVKELVVEDLEPYDKWFAQYHDSVYFPYEFTIWQYSNVGKVDGIKTDVDLNISLKEW